VNLYWIGRPDLQGYDEYSEAVVAAETSEQAQRIHPNGWSVWSKGGWDTSYWPEPERVRVELLGGAVEGTKEGVICASFHAG